MEDTPESKSEGGSPPTPPTPPEIAEIARRIAGKDPKVRTRSDSDSTDSDSSSSSSDRSSDFQAEVDKGESQAEMSDESSEFGDGDGAKKVWPDGPKTLEELFEWPDTYSDILLGSCESASTNRESVRYVLSRGLVHHDAYSGLGTASITGKQQLTSMMRLLTKIPGYSDRQVKQDLIITDP